MNAKYGLTLILCSAFLLAPAAWAAQNSQDFGNYVVYYNAFTTDTLQPATARAYHITRSKNRAMINLSVQKKMMNTVGVPVQATVTGFARNLNAQVRNLNMREIKDGKGIYYVAVFPVSSMETMDFSLKIAPKGKSKPFHLKFHQQFYTQ